MAKRVAHSSAVGANNASGLGQNEEQVLLNTELSDSEYYKVDDVCLHNLSSFWSEKAMIVIDYMQIYALIWAMALPWPYPYTWSKFTR